MVDDKETTFTKAQELRSFLFLSVVMAPVLAGDRSSPATAFVVWMFQLVAGPPGELSAPHRTTPVMLDELHITSLVVHSTPRAPAARVATRSPPCPARRCMRRRPPASSSSRSKPARADEMLAKVAGIQRTDGVLSAALVYQCADTLEAMNEEIPDADRSTGLH